MLAWLQTLKSLILQCLQRFMEVFYHENVFGILLYFQNYFYQRWESSHFELHYLFMWVPCLSPDLRLK